MKKGALMNKKLIALISLAISLIPVAAFAAPAPLNISAKSAIVMVASTGEVLFAKNASEQRYPASTTKMMTIIAALEEGKLDDMVTTSFNAANTEGSSMYLLAAERLQLKDMLYGVALVSGNDAAVAIAEHIAGSTANFAKLMTAKAHSIGATGTNFTNPSGLPDPRHYSTAHDLARIAAYGYKNPKFAEIVGTVHTDIVRNTGRETYYNENKLLNLYRGANGVKTGYTDAAGRCLVSAAKRGNTQVIAVVLDADSMWEDSMTLLDYGFNQLRESTIVQAGEVVDTVQVTYGKSGATPVVTSGSIVVPVSKNSEAVLQIVVDVAKSVDAPVVAGQSVGAVKVVYQGQEVASTELILTETIQRKSLLARIKEYFAHLFTNGWASA
jgi:D-alanyl-D-alanine carboxypeptidase (penicillin-binding protein 5/6)